MPFWPTEMRSSLASKSELRRECMTRRLSLSPAQKEAADRAICDAIAAHPVFLEADLILAFSPVRGEVDLTPLYRNALARGTALAFPRCVECEMIFHLVKSTDELFPDRFDIPAPTANAPVAHPCCYTKKTLCLMPGLAASKDGTRLGYGGGFYDRFLATFTGITMFPVYESLLFSTLPTEETDKRVMHIITEKGDISPNG